jgi:dienelactone hydrolase
MADTYTHLGIYSDWVAAAEKQQPFCPLATPGKETQAKVRESLGFCNQPEIAQNVTVDGRWEKDGVAGELVSWWVGYGPRTQAYVLRPAGAAGPLPGIVALHDHGAFKYYGKEKIADGPEATPPALNAYHGLYYGGRPFATALAREGFVVLVHDTFMWGSRKFPLETMPEDMRLLAKASLAALPQESDVPGLSDEIRLYNAAAGMHEHVVSKYANVLGTGMPGVVCYEDRVGTNYLLSRPDVRPGGVGCLGLSGGGNRTAMLNATHDSIRAAVIVGLMSTYQGLLDHNIYTHTWMFFPFALSRVMDWADLAACRAPSPLMVQMDKEDMLFTMEGMQAADKRLAAHYQGVGRPENYAGEFYPGPHKFDLAMQKSAFAFIKKHMA